jgi:hypothetical protein
VADVCYADSCSGVLEGKVAGHVPAPFFERRAPVTSLSVTVATYGSVEAAVADWDEVELAGARGLNLIDAALIERADDRVVTFHRCSATGWGHGSIACALVGALWPPALLDGALAGGVGRRALTFLSTGLSRDAINELGRVLESGPFVTLAVVERAAAPTATALGARALRVATLPLLGTAYDLRQAVKADEADA